MTGLRLCFPTPSAPVVSVVVVVRDAWEWTERCLRALAAETEPRYEVVLVDNGSTPETARALDAVEGATLVRNPANLGFGPAANQGVARSRAPYIVLLNSDAIVHEGWLSPLLEVVETDPSVAAVGPRLLNLDGTLQEAGSIVWREGEVTNYGDGDDPDRPEYCFRRRVDYVSAACLLLRRHAFWQVGGFDVAYRPAYFEDVDLCFALAEAGWGVVYEPRATVTHVRWGSGDRREAERLVAERRARFVSRWRHLLADRPVYPGRHTRRLLLAARDAACAERFLVLAGAQAAVGARVAVSLRDAVPTARVTVVVGGSGAGGGVDLPAQGIEAVFLPTPGEALLEWLHDRRNHYTAVFVDDLAPALLAAVRHSQTSAVIFRMISDAARVLLEARDPAMAGPLRAMDLESALLTLGAVPTRP